MYSANMKAQSHVYGSEIAKLFKDKFVSPDYLQTGSAGSYMSTSCPGPVLNADMLQLDGILRDRFMSIVSREDNLWLVSGSKK